MLFEPIAIANEFNTYFSETGSRFRARPMYQHTDIYRPIWQCCRCIVSAKFRWYISAIFAHKSVALLFCMERSETQIATSSLTLID